MRLIIVDGLDGVGKDTHAQLIRQRYEKKGEKVIVRSHPESDNFYGRTAKKAFLAGAGREIMKDVMDFEGDKRQGVKSFPRYIGIRVSNGIAAIFYLCAIALSFLPFFLASFGVYYRNITYFILVFITDTMLLSTCLQLVFKKHPNMKFHRKYTLVAFFIGLLAFLVGAFIGG